MEFLHLEKIKVWGSNLSKMVVARVLFNQQTEKNVRKLCHNNLGSKVINII